MIEVSVEWDDRRVTLRVGEFPTEARYFCGYGVGSSTAINDAGWSRARRPAALPSRAS